jgi:acetyl-CoA acetyltransferase
MRGQTAIAGLGMTEMGKVYGRTATDFAAEALALALEDAGLAKADVDGLLVNANHSPEMAPMLQMSLGLEDLTLVSAMSAYGSSAGAMLQYAACAITAGQASVVACLYADAPLAPGPTAASRACASPTATTGRRTRATRSRAAGTCTCTARRTTSWGRSPSASARGRS